MTDVSFQIPLLLQTPDDIERWVGHFSRTHSTLRIISSCSSTVINSLPRQESSTTVPLWPLEKALLQLSYIPLKDIPILRKYFHAFLSVVSRITHQEGHAVLKMPERSFRAIPTDDFSKTSLAQQSEFDWLRYPWKYAYKAETAFAAFDASRFDADEMYRTETVENMVHELSHNRFGHTSALPFKIREWLADFFTQIVFSSKEFNTIYHPIPLSQQDEVVQKILHHPSIQAFFGWGIDATTFSASDVYYYNEKTGGIKMYAYAPCIHIIRCIRQESPQLFEYIWALSFLRNTHVIDAVLEEYYGEKIYTMLCSSEQNVPQILEYMHTVHSTCPFSRQPHQLDSDIFSIGARTINPRRQDLVF